MSTVVAGLLVLLPNAASLLAMRAVGTSRENACPPGDAQPPGYVFAIVWPVLYLLLGVAMSRTRRHFRVLAGLLALMCSLNAWWVKYGNVCRPTEAFRGLVGVLVMAIAVTVYVALTDATAACLLLPLVAWLATATTF